MDRIIHIANKTEIYMLINSSKFDDVFLDYFIKYNVGGIFALVQSWLENDLNESPQEIVNLINNTSAFHP